MDSRRTKRLCHRCGKQGWQGQSFLSVLGSHNPFVTVVSTGSPILTAGLTAHSWIVDTHRRTEGKVHLLPSDCTWHPWFHLKHRFKSLQHSLNSTVAVITFHAFMPRLSFTPTVQFQYQFLTLYTTNFPTIQNWHNFPWFIKEVLVYVTLIARLISEAS